MPALNLPAHLSFRASAPLLLALLCTACAHTSKPGTASGKPATATAKAAALATPAPEDDLPLVNLTQPIFYLVMEAEIALQRAQPGQAYGNYLLLARQTGDPRLARRATEIALYARALPEALEAARLWQQLAPRNEEAAQGLLSLQLSAGHLSEAETPLANRLQQAAAGPERQALIQQLPQLLSAAPNKNEALLLAERLLAKYDQDPGAQLALAQTALIADNRLRALQALDTALTLQPDLEPVVALKTQILLQQNESAQAVAVLKAFVAAHPNALSARAAYARALLIDKQVEPSRQQFAALLAKDPHNAQAQFALGALAADRRETAQAEAYFRLYLASAKHTDDGRDTSQARVYLARVLQEQGKTKEALEVLEGIEGGRLLTSAILQRADILVRSQRRDEALMLLKDARMQTREPADRTRLLLAEAKLFHDARQYQQAFELLDQAVKQQPDEPDLLYEHGMLAEKINRLDAMEKSLRTVMKLRPDNPHAYNALGYSLADRNLRLKEALALVEKALALEPDNAAIIDSLGWTHYRLGNLAKAAELLQRAQQLQPEAEILVHFGEVLWAQGKHEEAKKVWRDARSKEPGNEVLGNTLKRLKVTL